MTTPKDNTEVVRMLRDVKQSLWKSLTPMKDIERNFPDYISSLTGGPSSSSRIMTNIATRLNFSSVDDSILQGDSSFLRSFQTPESLKRKLMVTEAELHASQAKLHERESLISIMEPNNKKICVGLENKLEECKRQNQLDCQKIEELRSKLKWTQGEAAHAKSKIHEIERQKKIDIDKLEMKMLTLQQECSNMKAEMADVKSEKAETVRKLNIEIGRLELKVTMLKEENEKSQEYIQTLKRQKNELADKAAMSSALEKELKEATERIKILENKIEAEKDAALIVQTRQSELKKLAELQKENRALKEEVNKNRENNIALYQEKIWSYQEKLKLAEKKNIAYAKLQVENEQLKGKLAQWNELFDDKSSPFKSPTALSMKLAQHQKSEIVLTNKVSQLSNHCETLLKQKSELEETNKALNRRLQQYQMSSPNQDSLIKRLQRKVIFLTKERDHCRKLLDSYLSESTLAGPGLNAELISHLEDMNMEYKRAMEKTEKELENLTEKMKVLTENNKTDKLILEVKKLQEEKSECLTHIAALQKEKDALEAKCSETNMEQIPDWGGKILHLQFNPLDNANKRHLELFRELQNENDRLKKRVKVLEEEGAAATDVTIKVQQKLAEEGSDSTIKSLQEQLIAAEKQQRYILDSARAKSTEFREAVYRLTGYCIDVPTSEQYKLSHVYAESRDDYLLFQINSDGVQLIETEYSKQLLDRMELYLHQHDSFPAFLASLTIDLFSQQTYMVS